MSETTRRAVLLLPVYGALASACEEKPLSCNDNTALTKKEKELRKNLGYAEPSEDKERTCELCSQFIAARACGQCKIMPGPTHPLGTCNAFSPIS